jgi:DNA-binding transcriptional regulator YiaG
MTADQFRASLDALDLTQNACARFLDIDERTVRRWSQEGPPRSVALLLGLMLRYGLKADDL